ncbi:dioxygenase family protein [Methylocaldum szegediense]|uniref:Protocatechuate 3,4-dioxygenase, beta subunit n=1 Tax=Methylocaldum szegediense TaxID=73780 RepID=A0ABM9HZ35_9GAMM|nr:protocatechuate 3,4-dioxygenase [Methylocaldum szegediense]CAI8783508.1 protocatechuate 3,4-dioxygenase, beta subunit [Methylocaldum szegediense]
MTSEHSSPVRRFLFRYFALAAAMIAASGTSAAELTRTPRQPEGPFYPDRLPPDTDNDLLLVNDSVTPAAGEVTHLMGRVLGTAGEPVPNAVVEIWQVDHNGIYLHSASPHRERRDENFQGFGRCLTGPNGEYYFRTIKPVPYVAGAQRTPHIHVVVKKDGQRMLTTQLYIKGHPLNEQDFILRQIWDKAAREAILVDFAPADDPGIGGLTAHFDIVIGKTPETPSKK